MPVFSKTIVLTTKPCINVIRNTIHSLYIKGRLGGEDNNSLREKTFFNLGIYARCADRAGKVCLTSPTIKEIFFQKDHHSWEGGGGGGEVNINITYHRIFSKVLCLPPCSNLLPPPWGQLCTNKFWRSCAWNFP